MDFNNQKNIKRPINENIKEANMLVIDENGNKIGVMTRSNALNEANARGYDLILIVPRNNNNYAICKIGDYGKMLYEQKVKERMSRKKQSVIKIKEIKVRPQIAENDLKWMANNAINWLNDNNHVKFKIRAFGRIGTKAELIEETYKKFLNLIGDAGKVLSPLKKTTPVLYEATIVKNK